MPKILETKDFIVEASDKPHHSRENGGHIIVYPKKRFVHRHEMPLDLAARLTYLTMVTGEAATTVLRQKQLDVIRINYQDNGNWAYKKQLNMKLHVHIHLYFRTSHEKHPENDSRFQAFPEALVFPPLESGYYDHFQPLTEDDCGLIQKEVKNLLETPQYKNFDLE